MSYKTDIAYLATCTRLSIVPSALDYDDHCREQAADAPDTRLEDAYADCEGGDAI